MFELKTRPAEKYSMNVHEIIFPPQFFANQYRINHTSRTLGQIIFFLSFVFLTLRIQGWVGTKLIVFNYKDGLSHLSLVILGGRPLFVTVYVKFKSSSLHPRSSAYHYFHLLIHFP